MVPECCTVLHNAHGTAPGMWFEQDGRVVISLPGVPFEMQHLIDVTFMGIGTLKPITSILFH